MDHTDAEDDFTLMLSQSQPGRRHSGAYAYEDDMNLWLSQSQPSRSQPTLPDDVSQVDDMTASAANVQTSITHIEHIIKQNHSYLMRQNDMLLQLISDISVNVADIIDRVGVLERKNCVMNKTIVNNKNAISEIHDDIEKVNKAVKDIKKKHVQPLKSNKFEERLKLIEDILADKNNRNTTVNVAATMQGDNNELNDRTVYIKNLPYGMKDDEDVHKLLNNALGLNIKAKSIQRAPSVYNRAGVISIEFSDKRDKIRVMQCKRKLRYNECYSDVYIDETMNYINNRMQSKFQMPLHNMHKGTSNFGAHVHPGQFSNRRPRFQ